MVVSGLWAEHEVDVMAEVDRLCDHPAERCPHPVCQPGREIAQAVHHAGAGVATLFLRVALVPLRPGV